MLGGEPSRGRGRRDGMGGRKKAPPHSQRAIAQRRLEPAATVPQRFERAPHGSAPAGPSAATYFRQLSTASAASGHVSAPPPTRDLWGLSAGPVRAALPNGMTPFYEDSVDDGDQHSAPSLALSLPPLYTSTGLNRHAPPSHRRSPTLEPLRSSRSCESPSLAEPGRPAFPADFPAPLYAGGESTGMMCAPDGRNAPTSPAGTQLPLLSPPPPVLIPSTVEPCVPAAALQAIVNDYLGYRFWSLGGTMQTAHMMEPERQLLQEMMFYHCFRIEEAQRQAQLATHPAILDSSSRASAGVSEHAVNTRDKLLLPTPRTDAVAVPQLSHESEQWLQRRYRQHRFGRAVQWDLVLPFWRGSAPLTVEAVSPTARRRVEQWRWQSLVLEAALSYTPAILDAPADGHATNGEAPFASDPFSRLNGRARECPALPMTRRTAWDPAKAAAPLTDEVAASARATLARQQRQARALDGTSFMACLRQSLLIDQGVRHHRVLRAEAAEWRPLLFPFPFLNGTSTQDLHAALTTEGTCGALSRVHVEALSARPLSTAAQPTSPPQVCLDLPAVPTTAAATHDGQPLLSPFGASLEMGRPGEAGGNLYTSLTALFSGTVSVPELEPQAEPGTDTAAGNSATQRAEGPSTAYLSWTQWSSALRHPLLLANPLRTLVVEDVTGTCHIFCGPPSPPPSGMTLMWLRHRHTARQVPLLGPSPPLVVGDDRDGDESVSAEDYTLCPLAPRGAARQAETERARTESRETSSGTAATSAVSSTDSTRESSADGTSAREADSASSGEVEEDASVSSTEVDNYRFDLLLEEWTAKRAAVVRRMDTLDPPWRMMGTRHGPAPRAVALHITESQLPWLATQLCPDQDGLLDLQELHLTLGYDTVYRSEIMHAWLWTKSVLTTRRNLLVVRLHFAAEPGQPGAGVDSDDEEPYPSPDDYASGAGRSVLVGGIALPARTVARVSARVSARSLSSTSSVAGRADTVGATGKPLLHSAPSPPITRDEGGTRSASQLSSPAMHPAEQNRPAAVTTATPTLLPTPAAREPPAVSGRTPPLSPPPRPVMHQPQPRTAWAAPAVETREATSMPTGPQVSHSVHGVRPDGAIVTGAGDTGGESRIDVADAISRLAQQPVVGVYSTVPQPEEDPAVLREVALRGLEFVPSLQVLHVQNGPVEALRSLFRETKELPHHHYYGNMSESRYASLIPPPPKPVVNPEMVSALREIYFSTEQHSRARREAIQLEVTVHRFPSLEVLWIDAVRVHRIFFAPLMPSTPLAVLAVPRMPLRELHLLLDVSFSTSSLAGVETVPTLEVVHLERVTVNTLHFLGESQSLRELLLHACRFVLPALNDDGLPSHPLLGVERAPALETLSLAYSNEAKTVTNFAQCPTLRRLILTRCNGISSASLTGLEALPVLRELCLEFTRVSNLSAFAAAPSLRVLRLCGCKRVLRMSILDLERSPSLSELYLNDTNVITIANLGCGSSLIKILDLSGCRHLDDSGMQGLQGLTHLEVLNLSHTPVARVEFLRDCPSLATLYVERCPRLVADGLRGLEHLPRLQRLVATGCQGVEVVGFLGLSRSLVALHLSGCLALTSEGVMGLERCTSLRYLHLADTAVSSIGFLAAGARHLEYLNLSGCTQLTSPGLHGVERLPALLDLFLERLSRRVNDISFLAVSRSLRRVSLRESTGVSVYARRELIRVTGITVEH